MNSGLGPTLTIIVGGLLWLLYLAPNLRDRAETRTIERNARRIAATTQDLGIRPKTPMSEMTAREMALHRRELERLARAKDRHVDREQRTAAYRAVPQIAARHRRVKLTLSLTVLASVIGVVVAAVFGAWSAAVFASGFALLGIIGVVAVNTVSVTETPVISPQRRAAPATPTSQTWTPVRTPPVHKSIPEGAGLILSDENDKAIAARERAARIRQQAARATQPGVAPDPRFTQPAVPATDETGTIDITAALRARRAN